MKPFRYENGDAECKSVSPPLDGPAQVVNPSLHKKGTEKPVCPIGPTSPLA
ncbi:hypothetical protein GGE65_006207 [Skermanella aerolata]